MLQNFLPMSPKILPKNLNDAFGRLQEGKKHMNGSAFPRAVWAQQPYHFSFPHFKGNAIHCRGFPVYFCYLLYFDNLRHTSIPIVSWTGALNLKSRKMAGIGHGPFIASQTLSVKRT